MTAHRILSRVLLTVIAAALLVAAAPPPAPPPATHPAPEASFSILIFSRTDGYRHPSIPAGVTAIHALGGEHGFNVDATESPAIFTPNRLEKYAAVVFLNTTGDVLNDAQQQVFEQYIKAGGGYVGIHAAADCEFDWPWYGKMVGAYFKNHPRIQEATIHVVDREHPSTKHLPETWQRRDEWYDYRASPPESVTILARLDETTYEGGLMGEDHPIAWCHEFDGGRAWYTGGGHTDESFAEEAFLLHLVGGIRWAAGVEAEPASESTP
jgi:type 1 glutamine amidotransferase